MSGPIVVEQVERTIQAGSIDVLVEIVRQSGRHTANVTLTNLDPGDDSLDLSLADVKKLRDLADTTVTLMELAASEGRFR